MPMRLLSTPQGKSRRELDNNTQELRSIELDTLIRNKKKEISDLDKSWTVSLSEKGARNYEEEQLWKEKIQNLSIEVDGLESRRKAALVPLEAREEEVETKASALSQREESVLIRESEIERIKDLLEDRLDAVSEREQDATSYSLVLNNREFAISLQEQQIEKRMGALTDILRESFEEVRAAQAEDARRKAFLKGRDVSITERERQVDSQVASFEIREARILDRYKSLMKAITETNLNDNRQRNQGPK